MKKLKIILKSQNQEELTKRSSFKWNTWLLVSTKLVLQAKSSSNLPKFLLFFFFSLKTWKFLFLFFSLKIWTKFPLRKPKREPWKMSLKIILWTPHFGSMRFPLDGELSFYFKNDFYSLKLTWSRHLFLFYF